MYIYRTKQEAQRKKMNDGDGKHNTRKIKRRGNGK